MNKTFLTRIALGLGMMTIAGQASAQVAPIFDGNRAAEYVGARFNINTPASIAGAKAYDISNDGSGGANEWGAPITTPYINVAIAKAFDTLGAGTVLLNGSSVSYPDLTGKFALIFRGGNITFTRKAKLCENANAAGVIIVNNIPGGPVPMGNTATEGVVNIPVLMVSDVDGMAINNQLKAGNTVTFSLSKWGYNLNHDLGIIPGGTVLPHAYAMPLSQLGASNGNPVAYKNQTGAFIGNFGTSNETNVRLSSNVTFTPTGGSASTVHADSVTIASFQRVDSILIPSVATAYDLHATTTGRFDFNYNVSQDSTDAANGDNTSTDHMYVTDSIYSKSRYDFTNNVPFANVGFQFEGTSAYVAGPMYYISKGGYQLKNAKFTISAGSTTPTLGSLNSLTINLFKWVDADADHKITENELSLVSSGTRSFTDADSNFKPFEVAMSNPLNPNQITKVEDNTWYWLAADVPAGFFLGCDGVLNYQPRTYVRSRTTSSNSTIETFAPDFNGDAATLVSDINGGGTDPIRLMPFEAFSTAAPNYPDSTRFSTQKSGLVPSISMTLSTTPVTGISQVKNNIGKINVYPNPASDMINVSIELEKPSATVTARITDAMGKTIRSVKYSNIQKEIIHMNTADLAAGQYYMMLNTDNGPIARQFTVVAK